MPLLWFYSGFAKVSDVGLFNSVNRAADLFYVEPATVSADLPVFSLWLFDLHVAFFALLDSCCIFVSFLDFCTFVSSASSQFPSFAARSFRPNHMPHWPALGRVFVYAFRRTYFVSAVVLPSFFLFSFYFVSFVIIQIVVPPGSEINDIFRT